MKNYAIKEIFYSIQGEGFHSGRPAIFVRFSSCNFWSGREEHRKNAICNFCDTDFIGINGKNGGVYSGNTLIDKLLMLSESCKFVVLTGGEPLLQVKFELIQTLKDNGYYVAVETNGSIIPPPNIDWICCSPKSRSRQKLEHAHELKVVYPALDPDLVSKYITADHYYIQPLDSKDESKNKQYMKESIEYCKARPTWKLSLQTQKIMNID